MTKATASNAARALPRPREWAHRRAIGSGSTTPPQAPSVHTEPFAGAPARDAVQPRIPRAARVGLAVVTLLAGACGSSESGTPIAREDLPRLLADAVCYNIGPCCQQGNFPYEPAQCQASAQRELQTQFESYRSANVVYDAAAARRCVDAFAAVAKACRSEHELDDVCEYMFTGTVQPGQPCTMQAECVKGAACHQDASGASVCAVSTSTKVHGKLGESCSATCTSSLNIEGCGGKAGGDLSRPVCYTNDGLYCDSAETCAAIPALGQACAADAPCTGEAFCEDGLCIAKRTSGSCGRNFDACTTAAYCDHAQQCQLRKSNGATCALGNECADTAACTDGTCRTRTIASAAVCRGNL